MQIKAIFPLIMLLPAFVSFAQSPIYPPLQPTYPQAAQQMPVNPMAYPRMAPMQGRQGYAQLPQQAQAASRQKPPAPANEYSGYLGIVLDIIPSSVAAQLPQGTSQSQGVLVKKFAENSPAETSDLKPFDVILSYNGVGLNHPSQFIKLVRNDKPGKVAILKVVRKGGVLDIPITLGAQKTPNPQEFNGLAIKSLGNDKYQASIRFIGPNGNKQVRNYEGNRQELYKQAINARDLPPAEREQLLYAIRPKQGKSKGGFGSFLPFGGKNESGKDWMNPGRFFNW